ncbi:AimR family lysis-lysogeny pheromone receptor [Virgibacillus sp. DJP39]|uniref:AimR family lysis-lysogeny pheromone receptor n=1 Tax=Virgibacillus sp. DJP39 TaxID=3409790 RepID=UPI003BB55337
MNTQVVGNPMPSIANEGKLSLEQVISTLSIQYDDQTVLELIRKFCLQSKKKEIMKFGMEFLYMNGFYEDLQTLVYKNQKMPEESNNQWAIAYQLMLDQRFNRVPPQKIIHHLSSLHTNEPELICLIEFTKNKAYNDMNDFTKSGNFLEKLQYLNGSIVDSQLRFFYNIRMYEAYFIYLWHRNELILARKFAFRVLNLTQSPKKKAAIHTCLALTYTFDTYQQGIHHLNEAKKIALENGLTEILNIIENHNFPFFSAYHKKVKGVTTSDKSEQAHVEIAKGNFKKAENILRKVSSDSPFYFYYLGLATSDKDLLHHSYNGFIEKRSDHFFCRLPLVALRNMGSDLH